jgi:signal transduction histidine kinase
MESRPRNFRSSDIVVESNIDLPLWIKAQPHLLGQLVENLLDNACKYSRPGTPIVVRVSRKGEFALLSVEDSGCGIAREDLASIFEPFFRSSRTAPEPVSGVGLGLSVAQRIVQAFGGTVAVQSEVGHGSRFEVALSLTAALDREASAAAHGRPVPTEAIPSP